MGIKDIYVKPSDDRPPAQPWERLHPRQAEAYWAAEEEREELRIEALVREHEQDRAYDRHVTRCHEGVQKGNPPDSRALDRQIEKFSDWYPEITHPEDQKAAYEAGELELDLDAYEPFPWSNEWRRDHSEYERERYWEHAHPELCTDDQLRVAHAAWLKTPQGQREQQERYGWFGEPWPDQAKQAIDEGRFVPSEYHLGYSGVPGEREVQDEPEFNPYDNWPRYTQWWQPQPEAEP